MKAIQIFSVGYAVTLFRVGYEMLGVSAFSKYDTFTLKLKISWPAGDVIYLIIAFQKCVLQGREMFFNTCRSATHL